MDPQIANYFSKLDTKTAALLEAWNALEDHFQEAFDRDIDTALPAIDFSLYGDLSYLDANKVGNAFAAFQSLKTALVANQRSVIVGLLEIVR